MLAGEMPMEAKSQLGPELSSLQKLKVLFSPSTLTSSDTVLKFKLKAVQQFLHTFKLFDAALKPSRTQLQTNISHLVKCSQLLPTVLVEDFEFAQVQVHCDPFSFSFDSDSDSYSDSG